MTDQIKKLVNEAQKIVIIQADNPDGDSLASSLALEHILGDLGKTPIQYCGVDIPDYLKYMKGWDRVVNELPSSFDLSIIVDTGSVKLLETLQMKSKISWIASKPCIVLDHHQTPSTIDFAEVSYSPKAVSTTEVIYELAKKLAWPISTEVSEYIAVGILSDSLGLITEDTSARSIHIIAELVENGISLAELDNRRRKLQKKSPELVSYKGRLLERVEYNQDQTIAMIMIPWKEIEKYSHAYNPSMLVIDEMRQVEKVCLAIAFKLYPDGRITAKIRANYGFPVAAGLAEHFDGGGHRYASGFRVTDGRNYEKVKQQAIEKAEQLLKDNLEKSHETV